MSGYSEDWIGHVGDGRWTGGAEESGAPVLAKVMSVLTRTEGRLVATVSEVASEAGTSVEKVLEVLGPYLSEGSLHLDSVGDHIFLYPHDPQDARDKQITVWPQNLWSVLRHRLPASAAYAVWILIRDMERVGWFVEPRPGYSTNELGRLWREPLFAIYIRHKRVPVVVFPDPEVLGGEDGWLSEYEQAGAERLAVVCREGALDDIVTEVRAWMLWREQTGGGTDLTVVILEEPRYDLVSLRPDDGGVRPAAVTRMRTEEIPEDLWGAPEPAGEHP